MKRLAEGSPGSVPRLSQWEAEIFCAATRPTTKSWFGSSIGAQCFVRRAAGRSTPLASVLVCKSPPVLWLSSRGVAVIGVCEILVILAVKHVARQFVELDDGLASLGHEIEVDLIDHQRRLHLLRVADLAKRRALLEHGAKVFAIQRRTRPESEVGADCRRSADAAERRAMESPSHRPARRAQMLNVGLPFAKLLFDRVERFLNARHSLPACGVVVSLADEAVQLRSQLVAVAVKLRNARLRRS